MRVAVSGSSGLIGTALKVALQAGGHEVVPLVRRAAGPGEAQWDPVGGTIDAAALFDVDAVVHLAGTGIGDRRLGPARRATVRRSRVDSTTLLARTMAALDPRPRALVSASAVGYYGDRGDEVLTEDSPGGHGFVSELCRDWEAAAEPARVAGIRVVVLRTGIVLARHGGALKKQLTLFRAGLGGRMGDGRQWTSWVTLHDAVRALLFSLGHESLQGPVNVTAPTPVTNREFTATLGRALRRPALMAVPRAALVVALGRTLATEVVLASQRAVPRALEDAGFAFDHPTLDRALAAVLGAGTA